MLYVINLDESGLPTEEVEEVLVNTRAYLTIDPDDNFDQIATYEVTTQEADLFVAMYAWLHRVNDIEIMIPYRFSQNPIGDPKSFRELMKKLATRI